MQAFAIFALIIAGVGGLVAVWRQEWAALIVAIAVVALAIHPAFQLK
jgi:hypothetical protein